MSLVLALSDWPDEDRAMWHALQTKGGPLDDQGALAHLRATSLKTLEVRYGRWLRWIASVDPDALDMPPAQRANVTRLQTWLKDLAHTKPMSQLMFVDGILRILRAVAPDLYSRDHQRLGALLKRAAGRGDRTRKLGRVLSSDVLLNAGLSWAGPCVDAATTSLETMKRRRDGTMIALLALLPMRRRSFNALQIGTREIAESW